MNTVLNITRDPEGVLIIAVDLPDRSMNVLTPQLNEELAACIEQLASDATLRGAVITSGKTSFIAGADILDMVNAYGRSITLSEAYELSQVVSRLFRRLETCGKPVAAAINGLALGGGFELCLACHYRVLSKHDRAFVGLPEVNMGLLPGGGGTQRVPRLIGVAGAVKFLTEGRHVSPEEAFRLGLVHEIVEPAEVLARARRWVLDVGDPIQPWDRRGYVIPGGTGILSPDANQTFTFGTAVIARNTQRNLPAPVAILSCVFEGTLVPLDVGLRIESKYFAQLLAGPVARNLMRTMFVNKGRAEKLIRRPSSIEKSVVRRLGILGAGMMGSGIAYAAASSEIDVVLLDSTRQLAEKGKSHSAQVLAKELERGRRSEAQVQAILGRIRATESFTDLQGCDLVIEAVFERRDLKAEITRLAEVVVAPSTIFASNTSTLPITGLAEASRRPDQFIGLHFFSPVDKMPLVEVILGKKTAPTTLARALDFVAQIHKTPIVVNDSRGFYTSRVFSCFVHEGLRMLEEGIAPALIENAARMAGMPVGPLAVSDEVSIELLWKVIQQSEQDLGVAYVRPAGYDVVRRFVEEFKRLGRRQGGGFYDYPPSGRKKLWTGLAQAYPCARQQPSVDEIRRRLLYMQALETARCFEEGVITQPADADLGSVLGWGFPSWTGGTLSLIETVGLQRFVTECDVLAATQGARFAVPPGLRDRAARNELFYDRTSTRTHAA